MQSIDTAIRLMVVGQLILLSVVLLTWKPRRVGGTVAVLMLGVTAYVIKSSEFLSGIVPGLETPLKILSLGVPYFVWACAYVMFDFERPPKWLMILLPSISILFCGLPYISIPTSIYETTGRISYLASLITLGHALYNTLKGNLDDLHEPRRRFRLCFVACITTIAAITVFLELMLVGRQFPDWYYLSNIVLIATVVLIISVPLLSGSQDLLQKQPVKPVQPVDTPELTVAEQELCNTLFQAMDARAYSRTGLTIHQLAQELKVPEHQLRRLINGGLGYRNFSTFLNGYRIEEACKRLEDSQEVRIPVLTIALDAGFASLAPFNRAFRSATSMTPTEYRRNHLKPKAVVTKINA